MRIELILKNYRCFPDDSPAHLVLENDWVSIVGVNNSGKSSLLRFFFEYRPFFQTLSNVGGWHGLARGQVLGCGYGSSIRDPHEVFHNRNNRPVTVKMTVSGWGAP